MPTPSIKTQTNLTASGILKDEYAQTLIGSSNVEVFVDGKSTLNTTIIDGHMNFIIKTDTLHEGVHHSTIVIKENGLYNAKQFTGTFNVINRVATLEIQTNTPKTTTELLANTTVVDYESGVINQGIVTYKLDGKIIATANVVDGVAQLSYIVPITTTAGSYTLEAIYSDEYFTTTSKTIDVNVLRLDIKDTTINTTTIKTMTNTTIKAVLYDEYGRGLVGENRVNIYVDDNHIKDIVITGGVIDVNITTDQLTSGEHNITFNVARNLVYNAKNITAKLDIENRTSNITINTNTPKTTRNLIINATIKDLNGTPINQGMATIRFNNKTIATLNVINGHVMTTYTLGADIMAGRYDVSVEFNDAFYTKNVVRKDVDVIKTDLEINTIPPKTIKTLTNITYTGIVFDEFGVTLKCPSEVEVIFNGTSIENTTIHDGLINITIKSDTLTKGVYDVIFKFKENDLYNAKEYPTTLIVENRVVTINLTTNNPKTLQTLEVNAQVKTRDNQSVDRGVIEFKVRDIIVATMNVKGSSAGFNFTLPYEMTAGNYAIVAVFSDPYYETQSAVGNFTIIKSDIADTTITINNIDALENATINTVLHDEQGAALNGVNNVEILVDGISNRNITIVDGIINTQIKTDTLKPGIHNITIKIIENELYNNKTIDTQLNIQPRQASLSIDVNTPKTVESLDVNVTVKDKNGSLVNDGKLLFRVNYPFIDLGECNITGGVGHINRLLLPDIMAGNYTLGVVFANEYYSYTIEDKDFEVIHTDLKNRTINIPYTTTLQNATLITVIEDEFSSQIIGVNEVEVIFNGASIENFTMYDGIVNIKLPTDTLLSGSYDVILNIQGSKVYNGHTYATSVNVINSSSKILIETNTPKTMDVLQINATIVNLDETPINTGEVVFKINGDDINETVIANVVLNDSKVNINYTLPDTMKSGRYTVTVEFRNEYYNTQIQSKYVDILPRGISNITIDTTQIKTLENVYVNKTLHDEYGQTLIGENKVNVLIGNTTVINTTIVGGILNLEIPTDTLKAGEYDIKIIIHENRIYDRLIVDSKLNIINRDVEVVITPNNPYVMDSLDVNITLNDPDGRMINDGFIIFKINGKTLKDSMNQTIKVVPNTSKAELNYILPSSIGAGNYTITAIYTNDYYNQQRVNTTFTINKREIEKINISPIEIKSGENATFNIQLNDMTGAKLVGNTTVVIKLNNKTIMKTKTTDGIINITLDLSTQKAKNHTITIKVGENSLYNTMSSDINLIITHRDVNIKISTTNTTTTTSILPITAKITDITGANIDGGVVIFKINNKTLKDSLGNEIHANVSEGLAYVMYRLPESIGCGNYTITAAYRNSGYIQTDATKVVEILRSNVAKLTTTLINTPKNHNTTLKMRIYDVNSGVIKGSIKCAIKINNKTVENTIVVDGLVNIQLNTENLKVGNYMITVKTGENSLYNLMQSDIQLKIN